MANYGYNMTQARLIVAIPRRFPKLLQMNESSGVDDMSGLSELALQSVRKSDPIRDPFCSWRNTSQKLSYLSVNLLTHVNVFEQI